MNITAIQFSVVIPTYNRATHLVKAIESVKNQTVPVAEIIIIDDGSTDETRSVVSSLKISNLKYQYQENSERGAARNAGVKLATGEYIVFLDSDDFLYPDFIKNAHESILKNNRPGFLYMGFEFVNEKGKKSGRSDTITSGDVHCLVPGNALGCVGIIVKRDVALAFPFIETKELFSGEDWELWLRIAANHGIKADNRISAAALLHADRSMNQVNTEKLIKSKEILLKHAFADKKVKEVYGRYYKRMEAYCDTFIALHLILGGYKSKGLKFWFKGVFRSPWVLFSKRTGAIFKRLITG